MFNEQEDIVHSSLDQYRLDELDLFAQIDEIQREIRDLQARDVADEEDVSSNRD